MRIVAKGLTYVYNPKSSFATQALKGVDLTIEEGEFFGIIGHTGSGKSTFVQHLNALIRLTGGELKVGDYDLADKKCKVLELRGKVGMVFQYPEYQLFAETVKKDVAFGLKNFNKGISEEETDAAVREALSVAGLYYDEVAEKSPFELSGGQRRRVAIAGVIVTKPEVLILDEPAAGLDPLGKKELMELLHSIHGQWCRTIVIVSHDMDEIAENCTRAAVFSEGKVALCGTPKEIFSRGEELAAMGLDVPVTARAAQILRAHGYPVDTDFTCDDFVKKVLALYGGAGAETAVPPAEEAAGAAVPPAGETAGADGAEGGAGDAE